MGMGGDGDMHGLLFCFLVDCIVFSEGYWGDDRAISILACMY